MFKRVLIANRGEIALRISRALRELGVEVCIIHGREDRLSLPVRFSDYAIPLYRTNPLDSYLDYEAVIQAAKDIGAEAIHPGYGFLSENFKFARVLEEHNITFIGPKSEHIKIMGDKVSARSDRVGGDVSREGVQRDLLPLIEGTTVSTKHGPIKTDHILFIASGAFQLAKPSDLLPELQGRLPIRVELEALTSDDFKRILREPDFSLIKQYIALLKTENVDLEFSDDGIDTIANIATEVNSTVENIGARRLHTIIEKVLDDISFTATDRAGEKIEINSEYINKNLGDLVKDTDLSKFIL